MVVRQGSWGLLGPPRAPAGRAFDDDDNDNERQEARKTLSFWVSEAKKLPQDQRAFFLRGSQPESYDDYVSDLKVAIQKKADNSIMTKFSKKMQPIYHLANSIAPITTSAGQLSPIPASPILGGITCILSLSVRFEEYQSKVIETLEWMVDEVNNINLYRDMKVFGNDPGVKTCEINVAADILAFCVTAANVFCREQGKGKNSFMVALKMQAKDFEIEFGEIKTRFKSHLRALEGRREVVRSEWAKSTKQGVAELLDRGSKEKDNAVEAQNRRHLEDQIKAKEEQRRRFLEWLPSIDFNGTQDDNSERRVPGSGAWLLAHDLFISWRQNPSSTLLWLYGKPGSGKSHLATKVIEELKSFTSKTPGSAVAYVYCTSNSPSVGVQFSSILASLLAQLCRQLPSGEEVNTLIPRQDYSEKDGPRRSEIKDGIANAVSKFRPCYIVVDGLDECRQWEHNHFKDFCALVADLARSDDRSTKVLVLSRPEYPEIEKVFAGFPKIQIDDGLNAGDIQRCITKKVEDIRPDPSEEESAEFEDIRQLLLDNSSGTFLWPIRKINHLKEIGSIEDMKNALENASEGLDDLYRQDIQKILARTSPMVQERALKALLWITNSRRPLSKAELIEALSVKLGQGSLNIRQRLSSNHPLCTECADLIVETKGFFHLYHPSLRDFLLKEFETLPGYDAFQQNANETLAKICLTYLNFDAFKSAPITSTEELKATKLLYPLLEYASAHWGDHFSAANGAQGSSSSLKQLSTAFLSTEPAMRLSLQIIYPEGFTHYRYHRFGAPTALHVFAALDMTDFAKTFLDSKALINRYDHILFRPIYYSALKQHKDMTMWLLRAYNEAPDGKRLIRNLSADRRIDLLHMFAAYDWHDEASVLLSCGYDCNMPARRGKTPLHFAASHGALRSLNLLLDAGADPTTLSKYGTTPLIDATVSGNADVVIRLLSAVSDMEEGVQEEVPARRPQGQSLRASLRTYNLSDFRMAYLEHRNSEGFNSLLYACAFGRTRVVEVLLDQGASITATTHRQSNGLHLASANGHLDVVKALLLRRSDSSFINAYDKVGLIPLQRAIIGAHSAVAKLLLDHGGLPEVQSDKQSPLSLAIRYGCYDVAELLITSCGVDATKHDSGGVIPLYVAANVGWSRVLDILPKGLSNDSEYSTTGSTLLQIAAEADQYDFMKRLVNAVPNLELFPRENMDPTPLHFAAGSGARGSVEWLVKDNKSALLLKSKSSSLPIHFAAYNGELDCVKLLSSTETIDAQNSGGDTPLMQACRRGHLPIVEYLVEQNADLSKGSKDGTTPLAMALSGWHIRLAKYLLGRGANCTTADVHNHTPLHYAAYTGDVGLVKRLLDSGCDPSTRGLNGDTPLMIAVQAGWPEVIKLLLAKSPTASIIRDDDGRTCIHVASAFASPQMLELILSESSVAIQAFDNFGFDALSWAASRGRTDLVAVLVNNGYTLEGHSDNPWTTLNVAAYSGCHELVRELIRRGVDVEKDQKSPHPYDQGTSLIHAASLRHVETAKTLFKNGADPTLRDSYGLSAADYAIRDNLAEAIFASQLTAHIPLERKSQLATLRQTIIDMSGKMLLDEANQQKPAESRFFLNVLTQALLLFKTKASLEHFQLSVAELLTINSGFDFCDFCRQKVSSRTFFMCQENRIRDVLCSPCHDSYLAAATKGGSLPVHKLILDELEMAIRPLLGLFEDIRFGNVRSLSTCMKSVSYFRSWLAAITEAYSACDYENNSSVTLSSDDFPEWRFSILLEKLRNFQWLPGDKKTSLEEDRQEDFTHHVRHEIYQIYQACLPHSETARFPCRGHKYIKVLNRNSTTEHPRYVDAEGKLVKTFYEDILDYYTNLDLDEIDDFVIDDAVLVSHNTGTGDQENICRILGPGCAEFLPQFAIKEETSEHLERSHTELCIKLYPLFEKRQALDEGSNALEEVNKEIEVYEAAWKLVHAMLGLPFERSIWQTKQDLAECQIEHEDPTAFGDDTNSEAESEDSWHTASEGG